MEAPGRPRAYAAMMPSVVTGREKREEEGERRRARNGQNMHCAERENERKEKRKRNRAERVRTWYEAPMHEKREEESAANDKAKVKRPSAGVRRQNARKGKGGRTGDCTGAI